MFFTLMLASLSALTSAPDTKPDNQQPQGFSAMTTVADGSAFSHISHGVRADAPSPLTSAHSPSPNWIIPSTGENIPGAGQ
jgi:hypothetical protein